MATTFRPSQYPMQSGFTLIEVLVALLILAIGLLGVAALQFRGLQYNHDAYMRSQVNILAYDIADRMRLNADNADDYITTYTAQPLADLVDLTNTNNNCDDTAATDAAADLACWFDSIDRALPPPPDGVVGNSAEISAAGVEDTYTVRLRWWDRESNSHTVAYTFRI